MEFRLGRQPKGEWDPQRGQLTYEKTTPLKKGIDEVGINLQNGAINVVQDPSEDPRFVSRVTISAGSEDEARQELKRRERSTIVRHGWGRLKIETDDPTIFENADGTASVVHGDGVDVVGDNGIIRRNEVSLGSHADIEIYMGFGAPDVEMGNFDPDSPAFRPVTTTRQIDVFVPEGTPIDYTLKNYNGEIGLQGTTGKAKIDGIGSEVKLSNVTGGVDVNTQRGVTLDNVVGDVDAYSHHGITVKGGEGSFNIRSSKGDITVSETVLGPSSLSSLSGGIVLEPGNGIQFTATSSQPIEVIGPAELVSIDSDNAPTAEVGKYEKVGTFGNEPTAPVRLDTNNGSITLRQASQ